MSPRSSRTGNFVDAPPGAFEPASPTEDDDATCLYCTIGIGMLPASGGVHALGPHWSINAELQRTDRPHFIIQTRRHVPDFAAMNAGEASDFGRIVAALEGQMKERFGAERVAISYLSENWPPHVHLRFIPRFASDDPAARGLGLLGAPAPIDYAGPRDVEVVAEVAAAICAQLGYVTELPSLGADDDLSAIQE